MKNISSSVSPAGHTPEKFKTEGVMYSAIKYGCGCTSEMDRMDFCSLHGLAPDLLKAVKRFEWLLGFTQSNALTEEGQASLMRELQALISAAEGK